MTAHDDNLLNQINRLLRERQATGDDLLDSLAEAAPQADAGFQNRLEEQLMAAQFATNTDERTSSVTINGYMTHHTSLPQSAKARSAIHIPFTLAALLLVVLLGGGLILTMQSNTPNAAIPAYVPQATPEIPSDLQPVVIALRDIRSRMYIAPQWLAVVYWPADLVPDGAYSDIESLQNTIATTDIAQYQPLTTTSTTDVLNPQNDSALVEIPLERIWSVETGVQPGMVLTLIDDRSQLTYNGRVIEVSGTTIVLSVPAHAAAAISEWSLSDRAFTFTTADSSEIPAIGEGRDASVLPAGYVAVSVQLELVNSVTFELQVDDWVQIWATMIFIDNTEDPDFQRPQVVTQQIIETAQIVYLDTEAHIITLAVRPQDATVLVWLVDADIPLTFTETEAPNEGTSEYGVSTEDKIAPNSAS